ncbi:ATP-binding protein [Rubripirellula tenax]|nr:ATP-binding protein [Rubripirellula tenax]
MLLIVDWSRVKSWGNRMFEFFQKLFDTSDYPPRWFCGNWSPGAGWLHVLSDVATFAAYVAIPMALLWMVRRRGADFRFPKVAWLFAAFIFACGSVHLVEAIIFWHPIYRLSGLLKLITAVVSWASVIAVIRVAPLALNVPGVLAINEELRLEVERRARTEERLTAILTSMSDGVIVSDAEGNIELVNPAAVSIFKFDPSDRSYSERLSKYSLLCDEGKTELRAEQLPLRRAAGGEEIDDLEINVLCESKSVDKTILLQGRPIQQGSGKRNGGVVIFRDITQLNETLKDRDLQMQRLERMTASAAQVTHALQSANKGDETFLRVIADVFDCSTVMLSMCEPENTSSWQDNATVEIYRLETQYRGITKESHELPKNRFSEIPCDRLTTEAIGLDVFSLIGNDVHHVGIGGLVTDERVRGVLIVGDRPEPFNNEELDLLKRLSRLISAAVFTRHQIEFETNARIAAEKELTASRKQLERLSRINSVGEMTAGIAHELNQPLTALINFTDAAHQALDSSLNNKSIDENIVAEARTFARRANEQALRAAGVLKSIRSMVQLDSISFSNVRIGPLIDETCRLMCDEIGDHQADIDVSHVNRSIEFQADRIQVEQLLTNLIRNALQAMAGTSQKCIKLSATSDATNVTISVQDTGGGIAKNESEKIFDAFFTNRSTGLGLGLKICRSIVELHGGHIQASNAPSGGAVFTVTLPTKQSVTVVSQDRAF